MKALKKSLPLPIAVAFGLPMCAGFAAGQQWIAPTPDELSMTSIKEVPGAAAVILDKDESTDDSLHAHSFYYRMKILTERASSGLRLRLMSSR